MKKVMSLNLKAKCSPTALIAQKQCSECSPTALHWGQVNETKRKLAITALTALLSAVTPHFANKNKRFPSCACERAFCYKQKALRRPPCGAGACARSAQNEVV